MANPLNEMKHTRLEAVITHLSKQLTDEHGEAILKNPGLAVVVAAALNNYLGITVGRSLGALTVVQDAAEDALTSLAADGYEVSLWARYLLDNKVTKGDWSGELVLTSLAELGFHNRICLDESFPRARTFELEPCMSGIVPALCIMLKDRPVGESVIVATEPMTGSSSPFVFQIIHSSKGLWLDACTCYPTDRFNPDTLLIFSRSQ